VSWVCLFTYMYKLWLIICLKVYGKRFGEIVQSLGFNVCIILDQVMASAPNFTNTSLLCSTKKSKHFPSEPWNWSTVCAKEEYSIMYSYWFNEIIAYKNSGCIVRQSVFEVIHELLLIISCEVCRVVCKKCVSVVTWIESEIYILWVHIWYDRKRCTYVMWLQNITSVCRLLVRMILFLLSYKYLQEDGAKWISSSHWIYFLNLGLSYVWHTGVIVYVVLVTIMTSVKWSFNPQVWHSIFVCNIYSEV
jgi:hypothetical protein